jgi:hypothetical protein
MVVGWTCESKYISLYIKLIELKEQMKILPSLIILLMQLKIGINKIKIKALEFL